MPQDPIHNSKEGIERLLDVMRRLRDPDTGCPWDICQTFETIAPYTIEEAYEVADAIERKDWQDLKGELGDLLLQTVYHTSISEDQGLYDFTDVAEGVAQKMIMRHPHVFGDDNRDKSAEQQTRDWEEIKAKERKENALNGTLDGVAISLPALTRAVKLQKRAARVGFDWPNTEQVIDKIAEEAGELQEACQSLSATEKIEEFGDLLFVVANLARHLDIDPEQALRSANAKFVRRFEGVEAKLRELGKRPQDSSLQEMDTLWDQVKEQEKAGVKLEP